LLNTIWPSSWPEVHTIIRSHGQWKGELYQRTKNGREVIVAARLQFVTEDDGIEPPVITLCDEAEAACTTIFPGFAQRLHWSFEDPAEVTGSEDQKLAKFREVRDGTTN
jgi:hypothetical protein